MVDTPTRDPRTLKERVKDGFASFRSQWVDSLYPLLYTIGSKQLYERAWVETRGAIGRADKLVQYGNDNTKSLTEILKDVPENEHRDFMQYCVNRHLESLARDVESGRAKNVKQLALSSKEYKANADAIQQLRPEWEQKRKDLVRFQQEALLYLVEGGIMSKETYDNMIQTRPEYMPLTREFTPEELDGLVKGVRSRGLVDLSNPLKTLKGSKRAVVDPLQQILKNVYLFAEMGSRNSVGQDIAQMVDSGEIDTTIIAPSDGVATGKDRRVFHVWRDGVKTFFETDPDIYRALAAPDYESSGFVARILQKPTSWLRFGATRSPDFMMRNMIRDALHASVFSENGFVPFLDNFRGLMHAINKDALFQEFLESGASQSTLVSLDRDVLKKRFQDIMKENGGFKMTALLNPKTALDILSTLSEYSELSTRLGEFGKARAKGLTLHDSALAARDVSLDFHRSGSKGRVVNQYVAFFNAGVQGIDKMVRGFYDYSTPGLKKKERIKPATFKRALMYITLPSLALYFANMSDPERREVYEELPQWQRDLFWCFVMKNEAKTVIRIPKPFEIGIIFGSMAERFLDWTYNKDPRAFKEMGDTFSTFLPGVMPTAVAPIIEWMTNYSFFLERSLVPMGEERLPAEQQYGPHTSQTAKGLGVLLENIPGVRNIAEFSPRKIDSLINSYTGGLGRYAVDYFGDPVASAFMDEEPSKPAKHLHEKLPGVKGLTTTAYRSPESVQRFFDLKDEINKGVAGDKNKGRPVKNEALNKKINDLARKIAEVRKKQKLVRESTMSPEDKRRQLDILDNRILSLAQQGVGFAERYGF